jgi:hypothetical protein
MANGFAKEARHNSHERASQFSGRNITVNSVKRAAVKAGAIHAFHNM